jgi:hypothetical protein
MLGIIEMHSQDKSVGFQDEKSAILNSNEITTILYNTGSICRPNTLANTADLVWKNLGYMFELGPLAIGQVISDAGDTIIISDDSFILPMQGGYSPDGTQKWGWLPDSGYARSNQNQLATRNNPLSWPLSWNTWPVEIGMDSVTVADEAYYVMDDYTNKTKHVKYGNPSAEYYPFPSDTSKRGLGLRAEVRVYQFDGEFKEALILKYKLINTSPKNLPNLYFGFQGDPHIGGALDYSDDKVQFLRAGGPLWDSTRHWTKNTIYCWDGDWIGMGGSKAGVLGYKFLETPNNSDLTSFHAASYTNSFPNVPKNIPLMWEWLSATAIDPNQVFFNNAGDYIINFGTGPFSLAAGESKDIAIAIFFSNDFNDLLNDATNLNFTYYWPNISGGIAHQGGNSNYQIQITSPNGGTINGIAQINWQYLGSDPNAKVFIQCSPDRGRTWLPLAADLPVTSFFNWNTNEFKDGVNYLLRIVAYNPNNKRQNYYDVIDNRLTINNPVNAQPELSLNLNFEGTVVNYSPLAIGWLAEDADNSQLNIKIEYSLDSLSNYTQIFNGNLPTGGEIHFWDIVNLPNSPRYYIKITASDGNSDTTLISKPFGIDFEVASYVSNYFYHHQGNATPKFLVQIIDTSQVTNDIYELTFLVTGEASKNMTIKNRTLGTVVLNNYPLQTGVSTPTFDGIKLLVNDYQTNINYELTKFNREELNSTASVLFPPTIGNPKVKVPNDWFVAFNDLDTNSSGGYIFPGDTASTNLGSVRIVTPFRIFNITENLLANFIVMVTTGTQNLSRWKFNQPIILRPQLITGTNTTYEIRFNFNNTLPHSGDTLRIITYKELTANDIFRFAVDTTIIVSSVEEEISGLDYALFNNYPNPFNPSTKIKYSLPEESMVKISIYNILGERVKLIIDENVKPGTHEAQFDGSLLGSGVYFYAMEARGNSGATYFDVKKMTLLK